VFQVSIVSSPSMNKPFPEYYRKFVLAKWYINNVTFGKVYSLNIAIILTHCSIISGISIEGNKQRIRTFLLLKKTLISYIKGTFAC